jgi:hypothetical protein
MPTACRLHPKRTDGQLHPLQQIRMFLLVRPIVSPHRRDEAGRCNGSAASQTLGERRLPWGAQDGSHPPSAWTRAPSSGSGTGGRCRGVGAPGWIPGGSRAVLGRCARVVRASPQDPQPRGCASGRHGRRPGRPCQRYWVQARRTSRPPTMTALANATSTARGGRGRASSSPGQVHRHRIGTSWAPFGCLCQIAPFGCVRDYSAGRQDDDRLTRWPTNTGCNS